MNPPHPGGFGPWFCAFIVNTARSPKKYTHVVAHTMPHLVVDALNRAASSSSSTLTDTKKRLRNNDNDDCWIMVFKIGPFTHWLDSVTFLNQWLCKTRGKTHRMERGLELFTLYREKYHLCLWTQTRKRHDALDYFWTQQPMVIMPPPVSPSLSSSPTPTAAAASDNQQQLEEFKKWLEETRNLFVSREQMTLGAIRARMY